MPTTNCCTSPMAVMFGGTTHWVDAPSAVHIMVVGLFVQINLYPPGRETS
jgi:hypothetical protein